MRLIIGVTFHTITLENEELSEQHTAENNAEALTCVLKQNPLNFLVPQLTMLLMCKGCS